MFIQTIKSIPGFAKLYDDTWFLRCNETYAYEDAPKTEQAKRHNLHDMMLCGMEITDAEMQDVVRNMPDVDDVYAHCDADYYLKPVDCSNVQTYDEDETSEYMADDVMVSGVHFLL